jgi:hypothetical protein
MPSPLHCVVTINDLNEPLLTGHLTVNNPNDQQNSSGANSGFWSVNKNNSLLKHVTDTRLSPSKLTLEYLDTNNQARFFATCKKAYGFALNAHLTQITDFLKALEKENKNKTIFNRRELSGRSRQCFYAILRFNGVQWHRAGYH